MSIMGLIPGAVSPFGMLNDTELKVHFYIDKYFIDESNISTAALEKYQRELDVKTFSEILKQTDEKAANELVLQQAFEGLLSIDNTDFLSELLDNEDLLNDIA